MIVIVDYGMGNLGSIVNMFKKIGIKSCISNVPEIIEDASKLLLPGVGAFDRAMECIEVSGLRSVLDEQVLVKKKPILGICLGMQLLTRSSEEGKLPGLSWIPAKTKHFPSLPGLRVPHMGWNQVFHNNWSKLTFELPKDNRFYFVHSYFVQTESQEHSILKCHYGIDFDAAIQKDNIFGVQFHPEKSHRFGMQLLKNFANF